MPLQKHFYDIARWLAGVSFITAAGCLAWYYFTFSSNNLQVIKQTHKGFYAELKTSWLNPTTRDLQDVWRDISHDPFNLLLLRTAMGIWRMREHSPNAYQRFIDSLGNGYLPGSLVGDLTCGLQQIDFQWQKARRASLAKKSSVKPYIAIVEGQGLGIQFPAGTHTADIGSEISITVAAEPGSNPTPTVYAFWETAADPVVVFYRCRSCTFHETGKTSGTLKLYRITMDMSDSPQWLYPVTQPTWIHFRGEGGVYWTPIDYSFSDSSLLPVMPADE